ncbi:hypothetical protein J7T55_010054 [Diaporthe amygdali]|uniref:uncharacterized protein n=1 Tax=Phomopsis amygdali TaxID=1214568 RepID=UPI0022FEC3A5|nr:uncharacterized protein J7T55_010054 [Diaporthe amygdali]KAJ0113810.1 hypothetical protein J7T55_010054 [Diaporthe amygdali]
METSRFPIDRLCGKRNSEEGEEVFSKRQRRVRSHLKSLDGREHVPHIRGGMSRPRPPPLGPAPNRATQNPIIISDSDGDGDEALPSHQNRILDSDEDDENGGRRSNQNQPSQSSSIPPIQSTNTLQTGTAPSNQSTGIQTPFGNKGSAGSQTTPTSSNQPTQQATGTPQRQVRGAQQQPTPPTTGPSTQKGRAGRGTSNLSGLESTTTTNTGPTTQTISTSDEAEIIRLFGRLQEMVATWVEECLPDTFPPDFQIQRSETYWELCGWCEPLTLGNRMLSNASYAKYVYEAWVWRYLYQEIFKFDSLTWAGNDVRVDRGGAGGRAARITRNFVARLFDPTLPQLTPDLYSSGIDKRRMMTDIIRNSYVTQERYQKITGWLITEMLVAFYPYFSDAYLPIDQPQNIEVLIRDTKSLILKARELDILMRRADHVYDLFLGTEGHVCQIRGVPSSSMQRYEVMGNSSGSPTYLDDDSVVGLIVVPGLSKFTIASNNVVNKAVVRHARVFERNDLVAAALQEITS